MVLPGLIDKVVADSVCQLDLQTDFQAFKTCFRISIFPNSHMAPLPSARTMGTRKYYSHSFNGQNKWYRQVWLEHSEILMSNTKSK